jgi:enoyl-CoA hydratase
MTETRTEVTYRVEQGVAVITIDRPERLNALNLAIKRLIERFVLAASEDAAVSVLILTGSASVFVAGTDIAEMREMTSSTHDEVGSGDVFVAVRACPKPIIAAVEGYALGGGCEIALACDMIIAGQGAKFGQPEIRVGVMPGAGGTQLLLRTIGKYRTMKLALTGEPVGADEALSMGMVTEVVAEGEALPRALALAATICRMPPLAVRGVKDAVRQGQDLALTAALAYERRTFQLLFDTQDQKEGMDAFLEKRRPAYTGK